MKEILFVGIGGALGSITRYLTGLMYTQYTSGPYPYATLTVNLIGSFLIGILSAVYIKTDSSATQFIFITGFCGGFTTFSTFSLDGLKLIQSGELWQFIIYASVSLVGGLLLCFSGFYITQKII